MPTGVYQRTEETRKKMSIAYQNRTEEHKKKMSEARKGKKHSEEARRKMSESQRKRKRKPLSEETKRKIGLKSKGRNCKKIINTKTGFIYNSIEQAAKSISVKRTYLSDRLTGRVKNETDFDYYKNKT